MSVRKHERSSGRSDSPTTERTNDQPIDPSKRQCPPIWFQHGPKSKIALHHSPVPTHHVHSLDTITSKFAKPVSHLSFSSLGYVISNDKDYTRLLEDHSTCSTEFCESENMFRWWRNGRFACRSKQLSHVLWSTELITSATTHVLWTATHVQSTISSPMDHQTC